MSKEILSYMKKLTQPILREHVEQYLINGTTTAPIIVEFDPTTSCNFKCPECVNKELLNKKEIDLPRTISLLDELSYAGVKGVIFIGGGEPLAHSGMPEPISYCNELGMKVGLTTNGSLIGKYIDVISDCVDWTRVSIDAAGQETFTIFRPSNIKDSFSKIIKNMENLAKSKKGLLGYSFLIIERYMNEVAVTNIHELYDAAYLAKEIGCDYFEYKPMVDHNHNLVPLSQNGINILVDQIAKMEKLNSDSFQIIFPYSLKYLLNGTNIDQPKSNHTCPILELRTLITPDGIYPCPYKRGYENLKLGDINSKFDEYWISKERQNLTSKVNPSEMCRFYCIRQDLNIELLSMAHSYKKGADLFKNKIGNDLGDVFI